MFEGAQTCPLSAVKRFSATRADDDQKYISALRKALEDAVRRVTGRDFEIFQDSKNLEYGVPFRDALRQQLASVYILIPVITPTWFNSHECKNEVEQFLKRQEELGRRDLILPIYLLKTPFLENAEKLKAEPLAHVIKSRQWMDWRTLRKQKLSSRAVVDELEKVAEQLGSRIEQIEEEILKKVADGPAPPGFAKQVKRPIPAEYSVDPSRHPAHPSSSRSIADAINKATSGSRISVKPGTYLEENITIDKDVELVGDGPRDNIILISTNHPAFIIKAAKARVANLTIVQNGASETVIAVLAGRAEIEKCDISGRGSTGITVERGAEPILRFNVIHDCDIGLCFRSDSGGAAQSNEIHTHSCAGIEVRRDAKPIIRRNTIRDLEGVGVRFVDGAAGRCEFNDVSKTGAAAIQLEGANPTLYANRIHHGLSFGIEVLMQGSGKIVGNDIHDNRGAGIEIWGNSAPEVLRNRIHDGHGAGIVIRDRGKGQIEGNEIYRNALANVEIRLQGNPNLCSNIIYAGQQYGVFILAEGAGNIERNEIYGNRFAGIEIMDGGNPTVRENAVYNGPWGVLVREGGRGEIIENEVFLNEEAGVGCRHIESQPTVLRNHSYHNRRFGIKFEHGGGGKFERNRLWGNERADWEGTRHTSAQLNDNTPAPPVNPMILPS